jgi:hypothetical protein
MHPSGSCPSPNVGIACARHAETQSDLDARSCLVFVAIMDLLVILFVARAILKIFRNHRG